jgi:hypothetical protein
MMRVDAAPRAEVVLRHAGIEPVNRERLFARRRCRPKLLPRRAFGNTNKCNAGQC